MKKRRLLSIVLSLCMVLALMPQMAFAEGESTTYDLWQVDGKIYYAATGTRTDFSTTENGVELPQGEYSTTYQLPNSGAYILQTNITLTEEKRTIYIMTSNITLDLNGKTLTGINADNVTITTENVTIQDSANGGKVNGEISINGKNSTLTLKSGTIKTITCDSGTLYADGGTVSQANTKSDGGTITQNTGTTGTIFTGDVCNGGSQYGNISGGIFYGEVLNGGSGLPCTISNGIFYGKVINGSGGRITGGEFHGKVSNSSDINVDISGGVFYGEVSNDYNSNISGGVFYGKVINNKENNYTATISGGVFYGGIEDKGGTITNPYHTVSFDLNDASGTAPVTQYFVNTNTAQALEPAAPTKEGYEFAGWYLDEELKTSYDFESEVKDNIILYAGWEEEKITLTVPFTTTVELGGNMQPDKTVFNMQVLASNGDKYSSGDVEIIAKPVTTNGAGSYEGEITFTGTEAEIFKMFRYNGSVFVKQEDAAYPNWEIDDKVWCLFHSGIAELSEGEEESSPILIFPAAIVPSDDGTGSNYEMDTEADPEQLMTFTNTYTKSVYVPTYPIGPVIPPDPPGDTGTDEPGDEDNPGDTDNPGDIEEPGDTDDPAGNTEEVNDDSDKTSDASPKTGDSTDLAPWIALMILSGAGIGGMTLYTRRKRTNE